MIVKSYLSTLTGRESCLKEVIGWIGCKIDQVINTSLLNKVYLSFVKLLNASVNDDL